MAQATSAPKAGSSAAARVPYRIQLHNIEACNCSHGCNCQFGGFPDKGPCEAIIAGEIKEGSYGNVSLAGVRYALALMYPKAIHEGGGKVVLFIDEKATQEQFDAIATILSGKAGGMPWEALAGTIASLEGPIRKPVEIVVNGIRSSVRVPGVLELRQTPIRNPVTGEEKEVQIVYPKGGFFWDVGNVTSSEVMQADYGQVRFRHPGGFASYAVTTWTNQQ
jgi:hypothetical protein